MALKFTLKPNKELGSDPRNGLESLAGYLSENPEMIVIVAICTVAGKTITYADPMLNPVSDAVPTQPPLMHYEEDECKVGLNIIAVESLWGEEAQQAGELLQQAFTERTGKERLPGAFRKALLHVHRYHPRERRKDEGGDAVLSATPADFIAHVQKRTRAE